MDRDRGFKLLLTTLPLLTAWLYLVGIAHHQGYLAAYGVHHTLLSLDFEGALVTGFISLFQLSYPAILYAAIAIFFLVAALSIVAAISLNKRPRILLARLRRSLIKNRSPKKIDPAVGKALEGALTANSFLGAFSLVILLLAASVLAGTKTGKSSALNSMAKFKSNESSSVVIGGVRSQIVGCNEDFCLFWDGKQSKQMPRQVLNDVTLPSPQGGT